MSTQEEMCEKLLDIAHELDKKAVAIRSIDADVANLDGVAAAHFEAHQKSIALTLSHVADAIRKVVT